MKSQVLWLLDNETDGLTFERLCTSLMYRWGFRRIVPLGRTADRGRDAEAMTFLGDGKGFEKVFFQYSLEGRWESKLRRELEKIKRNGHSIDRFVFITRKAVTGAKRDALTSKIRAEYGWAFEVFDREFLRHLLEEVHPGLAERYLGATALATGKEFDPLQSLPPIDDIHAIPLLSLVYDEDRHEEALLRLRRIIDAPEDPEGPPHYAAWAAMAWCYYKRSGYKEGLRCIEESLRLNPLSERSKTIKGSILCEQGIEISSRAVLVEARSIFEDLLPEATDYYAFYNFGNALSGLGEHAAARDAYKEALAFNDKVAEIWKNLGNCFYELKEHEEELFCYERALELNPALPEALVSKANTLAIVHNQYDAGLSLLNQALDLKPDIGFRWPHVYSWKAFYLVQLKNPEEALETIQAGLVNAPSNPYLLNLKASVLRDLWRQDRRYVDKAESFFKLRVEIDPDEVHSFLELAELARFQGDNESVFRNLAVALSALSGLIFTAGDVKAYPFDDIQRFVQQADGYLSYRVREPLEFFIQYYQEGKERYGYRHLWLAFGNSFIKLQKRLKNIVGHPADELLAFLEESRNSTKLAIAQVAATTAAEYAAVSVEEKVEILNTLLFVLPMTTLYEASRVSGFLIGIAHVDKQTMEVTMERFLRENDFSPWREEITECIMVSVNSVWQIFRENDNAGHK